MSLQPLAICQTRPEPPAPEEFIPGVLWEGRIAPASDRGIWIGRWVPLRWTFGERALGVGPLNQCDAFRRTDLDGNPLPLPDVEPGVTIPLGWEIDPTAPPLDPAGQPWTAETWHTAHAAEAVPWVMDVATRDGVRWHDSHTNEWLEVDGYGMTGNATSAPTGPLMPVRRVGG